MVLRGAAWCCVVQLICMASNELLKCCEGYVVVSDDIARVGGVRCMPCNLARRDFSFLS